MPGFKPSSLDRALDNKSVILSIGNSPFSAVPAISSVQHIEAHIQPLRRRLTEHPLYSQLKTVEQLRTFMESHVFAVWDFMSLLKALQTRLTCVTLPWVPTQWPDSRRFINEIVLGEESDEFEGRSTSHFELYVRAMEECGADSGPIRRLLASVRTSSFEQALSSSGAPEAAVRFMQTTFDLIENGSVPALASAFTFGREDIIPDVFRQLVRDLDAQKPGRFSTFIWYLERHIEVDGDDHGPLSLRMVEDLCDSNESLWLTAAGAAEDAIRARLDLWDGIYAQIGSDR